MGYVPPHLRDGAVQAPPSSSAGGGGSGSSFGGGNSSAFGARGRDASFGSGMPRTGSSSSFGDGPSRSNSSRSVVNVEPVFVKWQPSDRMLSLNAEQILDIRSRLNVVVEVPAGQPDCATPIESFKEMVRDLQLRSLSPLPLRTCMDHIYLYYNTSDFLSHHVHLYLGFGHL